MSDEDAPNYHSIVQNPMDMATLLQRVDCGQYLTRAAFIQDFDLIAANAKVSLGVQEIYFYHKSFCVYLSVIYCLQLHISFSFFSLSSCSFLVNILGSAMKSACSNISATMRVEILL